MVRKCRCASPQRWIERGLTFRGSISSNQVRWWGRIHSRYWETPRRAIESSARLAPSRGSSARPQQARKARRLVIAAETMKAKQLLRVLGILDQVREDFGPADVHGHGQGTVGADGQVRLHLDRPPPERRLPREALHGVRHLDGLAEEARFRGVLDVDREDVPLPRTGVGRRGVGQLVGTVLDGGSEERRLVHVVVAGAHLPHLGQAGVVVAEQVVAHPQHVLVPELGDEHGLGPGVDLAIGEPGGVERGNQHGDAVVRRQGHGRPAPFPGTVRPPDLPFLLVAEPREIPIGTHLRSVERSQLPGRSGKFGRQGLRCLSCELYRARISVTTARAPFITPSTPPPPSLCDPRTTGSGSGVRIARIGSIAHRGDAAEGVVMLAHPAAEVGRGDDDPRAGGGSEARHVLLRAGDEVVRVLLLALFPVRALDRVGSHGVDRDRVASRRRHPGRMAGRDVEHEAVRAVVVAARADVAHSLLHVVSSIVVAERRRLDGLPVEAEVHHEDGFHLRPARR